MGDPLLAPAEEKDQQTVRGQGEGAQGLPRPGVIRRQGTLEKLDGYLIGVVGEGFQDVGLLVGHVQLFGHHGDKGALD